MTTASASLSAAPTAAPAAFLRGVERRGAVLAELQAGDAAAGDAALAAAMAGFAREAGGLPIAQWPRAFWTGLLARPELRGTRTGDDAWARLAGGPRAALLLRLAAGLGENEASAVLGVGGSTYRLALQQAVPRDAGGDVDENAWQVLREQVQHALATLAPERLARLADAREAALRGAGDAQEDIADTTPGPARPRRLLMLLWGLLVLCAFALVATFVWPDAGPAAERGRVGIEPLPPADAPMATFDADAALVSHRDFGLLVDIEGERLARESAFYSWLAAGGDALPPPTSAAEEPHGRIAPLPLPLPLPLESADATL